MTKYKQIIAIAIAMIISTVSHAQSTSGVAKNIQAGINIDGAFPTGDFGKSYSFGIGGSVMGRYALNDKANLTVSLGYLNFSGKTITATYTGEDEEEHTKSFKLPSLHGIPLRLGANYLISGPLFIQGEIGAAFLKGGTAFLYSPGIGVRFSNLEVEAKYEGWSKDGPLSFIGVRAGYFF